MAKTYVMQFGTGDPRTFTGLSPTLLIFVNAASGATLAAPAVSEALTGSGLYKFTWGTTTPIAFLADAATTSPGASARYVTGLLDPADRADEYGNTMVAMGTTLTGIGTTGIAIGTTTLGYGVSNLAVGTTIYGYGVSIYAQGITIISLSGSAATLAILIGTTTSLIGNSTVDPSDLFGYIKRVNETLEGQQTFVKWSGTVSFYDRTGATLLATRTVVNNASLVVKT